MLCCRKVLASTFKHHIVSGQQNSVMYNMSYAGCILRDQHVTLILACVQCAARLGSGAAAAETTVAILKGQLW